jgi:hypothetical protein
MTFAGLICVFFWYEMKPSSLEKPSGVFPPRFAPGGGLIQAKRGELERGEKNVNELQGFYGKCQVQADYR